MGKEKPRQIAVRVLRRYATEGEYLESLLARELGQGGLSPTDGALVQELTYGVVRWQSTLDWLIAQKTHGRTQKNALQVILRLGLYQMFWLQRIPDYAIVHESVDAARHMGFGPQAGFVNALLRTYGRDKEQTRKQLEQLKINEPALGYSHPNWLCALWEQRWGRQSMLRLLQWNNDRPRTFARLNTLRAGADELIRQWDKEGVEYSCQHWDWVQEGLVYELKAHPPLATLPSFQQGWFYIQDPSTLLAVVALAPRPGEDILDMCAAPGGKTTLIGQLMMNKGHIVAEDAHLLRRDLVRENCLRLGVTIVELSPPPARHAPRLPQFDRVLVDAPCSNTGVMRRRVDIRWRIRPEEIQRLRATQLDLLKQAASACKSGGRLVYSTCSIETDENQNVVHDFLAVSPSFQLDYERTLLPFDEHVDGGYVARFIRKG